MHSSATTVPRQDKSGPLFCRVSLEDVSLIYNRILTTQDTVINLGRSATVFSKEIVPLTPALGWWKELQLAVAAAAILFLLCSAPR